MWQRLILHVSTASQQHADQIILHHRRHGYRRGRGKGRSPDGKAESWWLRNGIGNVVESTVATSRISGCSPRCNGSPVCQPSQRWSPLPNRRPPRLSRRSASGQTEPSDAVIASDRKSAHCGLSPTAAPKHEQPLNRLSRGARLGSVPELRRCRGKGQSYLPAPAPSRSRSDPPEGAGRATPRFNPIRATKMRTVRTSSSTPRCGSPPCGARKC